MKNAFVVMPIFLHRKFKYYEMESYFLAIVCITRQYES